MPLLAIAYRLPHTFRALSYRHHESILFITHRLDRPSRSCLLRTDVTRQHISRHDDTTRGDAPAPHIAAHLIPVDYPARAPTRPAPTGPIGTPPSRTRRHATPCRYLSKLHMFDPPRQPATILYTTARQSDPCHHTPIPYTLTHPYDSVLCHTYAILDNVHPNNPHERRLRRWATTRT